MDEQLALLTAMSKGFVEDTAFRHLGFVLIGILMLAGLLSYLVRRGEKDAGFSIRGAVDSLESAAAIYVETKGQAGSVWPIGVLLLALLVGFFYLAGLVIHG